MNAGDAAETEVTLSALVLSGSEAQEDHNTNFPGVLSSSKEQENNPPNRVSNSSSTEITPVTNFHGARKAS